MSGRLADSVKTAIAVFNPSDPRARGAGLLSGSSTSSYKASATFKVDVNMGADLAVVINPSPFSDGMCLWINTGNSTINAANPVLDNTMTLTATGAFGSFIVPNTTTNSASQLPFSITSGFRSNAINGYEPSWSPPNVRARVVSACLKATNTSATLSDNGTAYTLVDPQHENLLWQNSYEYFSQYTSCKSVPLTHRTCIEIVMSPVSDKMMQFSEPYEDVFCSGLGVEPNQGYTTTPSWGGGSNAQNQQCPIDPVANARAVNTLVYPLSRRNQHITWNLYAVQFTVSAAGVITWVAPSGPPGWFDGCSLDTDPYTGTLSGTTYAVHWNQKSNLWYLLAGDGSVMARAQATVYSGNLQYLNTTPACLGVIQIKGGPTDNGTLHLEYTVHCEYIGIAVQGRTTPIVPNPLHQHLLMATLASVRDAHGQESGPTHHIHHTESAVKDVVGQVAPEFADAVICAVCPEAGAFLNAGGKRSIFSTASRAFRRRL